MQQDIPLDASLPSSGEKQMEWKGLADDERSVSPFQSLQKEPETSVPLYPVFKLSSEPETPRNQHENYTSATEEKGEAAKSDD